MSLRRLLSQSVDVVRYGETGRDDLNRPIEGEISRKAFRARLYMLDAEEVDQIDSTVDLWRLILGPEAATEIGPGDHVEANGRAFEVRGTPDVKRTPRAISHVVVNLRWIGGRE